MCTERGRVRRNLLLQAQPVAGGSGLTDANIGLLAEQAGYEPLYIRCAVQHQYASWVASETRSAEHSGIDAVRVNVKGSQGNG